MAPPPGRGFIPPTMPPMFSGGFKHLWGRFSFCGFRCSSDHPSVPTPESTKGSNIRPIRPTKPPWVCRCTGSSCGERGDFGFLNQTTFYHWKFSFRDLPQPYMIYPAQTWPVPTQLWRDNPSKSFSPRNQKVRTRTMDLWTTRFPSPPALHHFKLKHQDQREVKQRLRFGNYLILNRWELFLLSPPSHAVLISQIPFQVQEDFESNFRPGFSQFGNFGQTTGRTVWGAPAEAWENNILLDIQDKSHPSSFRNWSSDQQTRSRAL